MEEEHLACPKCGYDLYGIPEVRCPECGFRYDYEALRSLAASAEWARLASARTLIVRAAAATALAAPAVAENLGVTGFWPYGVAAATYTAAFFTWVVLADAYWGVQSIPKLLTLFVAFALGFGWILLFGTVLVLLLGTVLLASAWLVRIRDWPVLAPLGNAPSTAIRRSVVRHSVAGNCVLIFASLLVLYGWLG
jgi:hypothetical protein